MKYVKYISWTIVIVFLLIQAKGCMEVDSCLDFGNVWDYDEKRCRSDCLAWIKGKGCIEMNEEFQKLFTACNEKTPQCDEKRLKELLFAACQKYQGAWSLAENLCYFDFESEECGKEPGKWIYPSVCDTKTAQSE